MEYVMSFIARSGGFYIHAQDDSTGFEGMFYFTGA